MPRPETTKLVGRLRRPDQWRSFPDIDDDAPKQAADEIERLRGMFRRLAISWGATDADIEAVLREPNYEATNNG